MADAIVIDLDKDLIGGAVAEIRRTFRVALPARVKSGYRDTSRADVTFGVRWLATNREVYEEPPAPALPVLLPRGGGYGVSFDVREGDLGVALSCDGPVFGLYDTGDDVTPQFPQGHDYGTAVFFPSGRVSNQETPTSPPNAAGEMTVGAEDGSATVVLRGAGLPSATEQGTVVIKAATHVAPPGPSLFLGSENALIAPACAPMVSANLDTLNTAIQSIPATGVPQTDAAITAIKGAFSAAFNLFVDIADAKTRLDGPA